MSKKVSLYKRSVKLGKRPIEFIENRCKHMKGDLAGQYLILEEWQKKILRDLFGVIRKSTGKRRYRTAYIEVPKKNGKTSWAAGIGLFMLLADGELGPEVYTAAADRQQAGIAYDIASYMAEEDHKLKAQCEVLKKSIYAPKNHGIFKALSRESKTKHGINPSGIIIDEFHAHPNGELADTLMAGVASRQEPLTIIITTAGKRDETSECYKYHKKAKALLAGKIKDDSFYAVIYGAKENCDITDEKVWAKANPTYPISPTHQYMVDMINRIQTEPTFENTFKQLHLNIWVGALENFIAGSVWDKCYHGEVTEEYFEGERAIAALDLGSDDDFTAMLIIFEEDGIYHVLPYFWIPEESVDSRPNSHAIKQWIAEGYIKTTPGTVTDYAFLKSEIDRVGSLFDIIDLPYDKWNSTQTIVELVNDGVPCTEFRQGFVSMHPAMSELLRVVKQKNLNHGNNPVLRWMNDNLVVRRDPAGNVKPDKDKSSDKIDGMVCLIMAIGRWRLGEIEESTGSIYEEKEVIL